MHTQYSITELFFTTSHHLLFVDRNNSFEKRMSRFYTTKPNLLGSIDLSKVLKAGSKEVKQKFVKPPSRKPVRGPVDGSTLYKKFNTPPRGANYGNAVSFFRSTKVTLECSAYKFSDVPGEKERIEREEILDADPNADTPALKTLLPEVALVGRCNVGKSSLINALFSEKSTKYPVRRARTNRRAGYTQCLNFFNCGGKFNLVDSPGFGEKGRLWQGELCMEYLERRRNLCKVYLLLNANHGVNQYDLEMLDIFHQNGINFDIVFNKIDKVKGEKDLESILKIIDGRIPYRPTTYFVNSTYDDKLKRLTGFNELRYGMLQSCGIEA